MERRSQAFHTCKFQLFGLSSLGLQLSIKYTFLKLLNTSDYKKRKKAAVATWLWCDLFSDRLWYLPCLTASIFGPNNTRRRSIRRKSPSCNSVWFVTITIKGKSLKMQRVTLAWFRFVTVVLQGDVWPDQIVLFSDCIFVLRWRTVIIPTFAQTSITALRFPITLCFALNIEARLVLVSYIDPSVFC